MHLIPMINAEDLPEEVLEWCIDHDYPVHCDSAIIEIPLDEPNPMRTWLTKKGVIFSSEEVDRGWGHAALMGT